MTGVSTGLPGLDRLLGGSVRGGGLTHVYGAPAAGKSTLCYGLLARALSAGGWALLLSFSAFSAERLVQVLRAVPVEPASALDRLRIARPRTLPGEDAVVGRACWLALHAGSRPTTIIVDGLGSAYRSEGGKPKRARARRSIALQVARLGELARAEGIPVVVTSPVWTDIETGRVVPVALDVLEGSRVAIVRLDLLAESRRRVTVEGPSGVELGAVVAALTDTGLVEVPAVRQDRGGSP